jgi:hypothetical protein
VAFELTTGTVSASNMNFCDDDSYGPQPMFNQPSPVFGAR